MIGVSFTQNLDDFPFGLYIGVADEIVALFSGDIQSFKVLEMV